ncbi:MAG: SPOR domain-containing protein [Sulfuricella sp.]|nr:SPOR domain-containing protein [Sulfuricella sp.]
MARDYKNRGERPSASKKEGHPMLAGVLIGLFVGLAAAIGVAFYIYKSPAPFVAKAKLPELAPVPAAKAPEVAPPKAETPAAPATPDKPAVKPEKQRFEFYDILQGKEAPVTEQEVKAAAQKEPAGKLKESYFLQAGSFQTEAEADNMKAKLALMGVEAVIQTANIPDKGLWHRVRVGPFANIEELNKARTSLAKNGIPANLVKIHE